MFAAVPDIGSLLLAALALIVLSALVLHFAGTIVNRLGVAGVAKPSFLALCGFGLVLTVLLLMFPVSVGMVLAVPLIWLLSFFSLTSREFRRQQLRAAVVTSSYIAVCAIAGLAMLLYVTYVALLA